MATKLQRFRNEHGRCLITTYPNKSWIMNAGNLHDIRVLAWDGVHTHTHCLISFNYNRQEQRNGEWRIPCDRIGEETRHQISALCAIISTFPCTSSWCAVHIFPAPYEMLLPITGASVRDTHTQAPDNESILLMMNNVARHYFLHHRKIDVAFGNERWSMCGAMLWAYKRLWALSFSPSL